VLDPQVHRVERDEFRAGHLFAHAALEIRLDVAEKQESRLFRLFRNLRLKFGEHVQVGKESVRDVQVVLVFAAPPERLAVLDSFEIVSADAARFKHVDVGEITANNADDAHVSKEAGRNGKVRGRAAKHLLALTERSFNCVVRDRTND
jgi:hypothetical protein